MNNKNYRVMKFFELVNKLDKSRGYVRLDIRGIKGNIIVSVENLGDVKSTSEVFLYKDRENKIKLGDINNKKGTLKKLLTFGSNNAIEDYNICAVVKDKKIVMYSNLFNASSLDQVKKLEANGEEALQEISKLNDSAEIEGDESVQQEKQEVKQAEATEEKEVAEKEEKEEKKETEIAKEVKKEEAVENAKYHEAEKIGDVQSEKDSRVKNTTITSAVSMNEDKMNSAQAQAPRYKNKLEENLYNVLKDYERVEPLSVKIKDFDWWHVPFDDSIIKNGFLPYYNQVISSYYPYPMSRHVTTCAGLMKKYKHYIFGIYKENGEISKFIYGIPGEFTKEEQPYKGVTGFKNWSYSNKEKNDKQGYWLAFVNPKTGETTEPPQIVLS